MCLHLISDVLLSLAVWVGSYRSCISILKCLKEDLLLKWQWMSKESMMILAHVC